MSAQKSLAPSWLLLGLVCLATLSCCQAYTQQTTGTITKIQGYIEGMINRTAVTELDGRIRRPMLPALVRLAFHDCNSPAGCDGCVNLDIAENNGLNASVSNLEGLYKNTSLGISTAMSRADFWALAGLTAANYGARLQKPPPGPGQKPYIPASLVVTSVFKTGRVDCATAPKGSEASTNFPDGLDGQEKTFKFFKDFYNFNTDETVAILGAHTLGRAVVADSGFGGPWVPDDNILNNNYYISMTNASLPWAQAKPPGGKIQWQRLLDPPPGSPAGAPAKPLIMLNADMCLYKNLTLNSTGGSKCSLASTCPNNTASYQKVLDYAKNNTKWLDDFGAAFNKMIKVCGHPSSGVVTACTLTSLKVGAATIKSATAQPEDLVVDAQPVLVDPSTATLEPATVQPEEPAVAEVQPVPVATEAVTAAVEVAPAAAVATEPTIAVMSAAAAAGAASALLAAVAPGAEPVVAEQAVPVAAVPDAPGGGHRKRRAARKLV